ncbi:hypothetical protein ABMA27_010432 [Loxostege sticticalis]|uniref:Reverse transcriptase domain-containing protein n=1 Tax=Loxostege sticticalis TaxID=481309 RepID=A0ABR3H5P2_LOXSC
MPTDAVCNLSEFTHCFGTVSAIIDSYNLEDVFVIGDFNAHPHEQFYNELLNFCNDNDWICIDIDKLGLTSGTFTFISDVHGTTRWLDHCLVTKSAVSSVDNVYVNYDAFYSDHLPLILDCNLSHIKPKLYSDNNIKSVDKNVIWGNRSLEDIKIYSKECQKYLKLIDFPTEFTNCCDKIGTDSAHRKIIDKMYCNIVTALSQAAAFGRGKGRARLKRVAGWNKHVSDAHREARSKFQNWLCHGKPTTGDIYNDMSYSRRVFKSRLRWCQSDQEQIKMNILAEYHHKKGFRAFWKNINKNNCRSGLPVSVDGVSGNKEIADLFKQAFAVKPLVTKAIGGAFSAKIRGNDLSIKFLTKDVVKAIKSISRGKSPGHDGLFFYFFYLISIEHLQYAGPHLPRVLAMLFTFCVGHSYLPEGLMRTVVVPIIKNKTGDAADKSNYRPISLATVIAKVFDSLLNVHINKFVTPHDNQFGFRSQLSTESAIVCMKQAVRYYTDRNTPVYACFLDLSKAFDLVSYDLLWEKLEKVNLPCELITILRYWYGNQVNNVRWADALSDSYRL